MVCLSTNWKLAAPEILLLVLPPIGIGGNTLLLHMTYINRDFGGMAMASQIFKRLSAQENLLDSTNEAINVASPHFPNEINAQAYPHASLEREEDAGTGLGYINLCGVGRVCSAFSGRGDDVRTAVRGRLRCF